MVYGFAQINLPPWLVTNRYLLMLSLIIPRKESCTFNNVNVYLQPLINELQILWKVVDAFDAYLRSRFNFKTMCMWSIHDFPMYGLFASVVNFATIFLNRYIWITFTSNLQLMICSYSKRMIYNNVIILDGCMAH